MKRPFADVQSALQTFIDSAQEHASASQQGDHKVANRHYDLVAKAVGYLREHDAVTQLTPLLNHSETSVRIAAAAYLLPHNEPEALAVLEQVAKDSTPFFKFDAQMIVEQWKKGKLKL